MTNLDLRPLSVGEILDRTFTLYRNHFVLFLGISAIPQILVLALNLSQIFVLAPLGIAGPASRSAHPEILAGGILAYAVLALLGVVVMVAALLLSQGATVMAVSELYLGRTITIGDSMRRIYGDIGTLLGVMILNGLALVAGFLLLVIPGFYVMSRLIVSVPVCVLEKRGASDSLGRSWELTTDNAGRAFLIYLLYFALSMSATALFAVPFQIGIFLEKNNPAAILILMGLVQLGSFIATVLVVPVLTIASSILYYDLRVRREAFDLQMMLEPLGGPVAGGVPRALT